MTYPIDILGRAPIMRQRNDDEYDKGEDWKQEQLMSAKTGPRNAKKALSRPTKIPAARAGVE